MQRSKTLWVWIALLLVFTLIGPVLGGLVFWVGSGVVFGAVKSVSDLGKLATGALAVSIAMAPLGMVQALITGIISGLVSRGTSSPAGWLAVSSVIGGIASVLSVPTALLVYYTARHEGFAHALAFGTGSMFISGAGAALLCASLCVRIRPRRQLADQSS